MTTKAKAISSSHYTPFYLIMLILSTIAIAISVWGIFEIFNLIKHFHEAPLYAGLTLTGFAVLPLSVTSLVLLYQKQRLGLTLLYASLGCNFLIGLGLFFCIDQMTAYTLATMSPEDIDTLGGIRFFETFIDLASYAMIVLGNLAVIGGGVLWHFAWRNQHAPKRKEMRQ